MLDWDAAAPHQAGKHFKLKTFIRQRWQSRETEKKKSETKGRLDFQEGATPSGEGQRTAGSGWTTDNQGGGQVRLHTQGQTQGRRAGEHRSRKTPWQQRWRGCIPDVG